MAADAVPAELRFHEHVVNVASVALLEERGQHGDAAHRVADDLPRIPGHDRDRVIAGHERPQIGAVLAGPLRGGREGGVQRGVEHRQLAPDREDLFDVFEGGAADLNGHGVR